jgi:hypothetical protein
MPVPVPGQDLHYIASREHRRLSETPEPSPYRILAQDTTRPDDDLEAGKKNSVDYEQHASEDKDVAEPGHQREGGIKGAGKRAMQLMVDHGVEGRGIEPVPDHVSMLE